jgi:hypothetical protein
VAIAALAPALIALVGALYAVLHNAAQPGPQDALEDFASAWSRGDDAAAGALTERPPAASAALRANRGGDPPRTHAWFIALRDDLAVAVLVERGSSGGSVAGPIAARFFTALAG